MVHQLFPDEIPLLLTFIKGYCLDFKNSYDEHAKVWSKNSIISIGFWFGLTIEMLKLLEAMQKNMERSHHLFADQMSYSRIVPFSTEMLCRYAANKSENKAFINVVDLLFNPASVFAPKHDNIYEILKIEPPIEMRYGETTDYFYCICGNYAKGEGFDVCDSKGNLIRPSFIIQNNDFRLCRKCGAIFNAENWTIVGLKPLH